MKNAGAELTFYHHVFELFEADVYAINFMDRHPEIFKKHAELKAAATK